MILIIVAADYAQFSRFIRTTFPSMAANPRSIERNFTHVTCPDDLYKTMSIERNTPVLFVGGDTHLLELLMGGPPYGRHCIPISITPQWKCNG